MSSLVILYIDYPLFHSSGTEYFNLQVDKLLTSNFVFSRFLFHFLVKKMKLDFHNELERSSSELPVLLLSREIAGSREVQLLTDSEKGHHPNPLSQ